MKWTKRLRESLGIDGDNIKIIRLQGLSIGPGYISVGKVTWNVISQNGGRRGEIPSPGQ